MFSRVTVSATTDVFAVNVAKLLQFGRFEFNGKSAPIATPEGGNTSYIVGISPSWPHPSLLGTSFASSLIPPSRFQPWRIIFILQIILNQGVPPLMITKTSNLPTLTSLKDDFSLQILQLNLNNQPHRRENQSLLTRIPLHLSCYKVPTWSAFFFWRKCW